MSAKQLRSFISRRAQSFCHAFHEVGRKFPKEKCVFFSSQDQSQSEQRKEGKSVYFSKKFCLILLYSLMLLRLLRCAMPNFVDPEFFRLHSEKKICVRIRTKKWLKIIITCPRLHKNRGWGKAPVPTVHNPQFMAPQKYRGRPKNHAKNPGWTCSTRLNDLIQP